MPFRVPGYDGMHQTRYFLAVADELNFPISVNEAGQVLNIEGRYVVGWKLYLDRLSACGAKGVPGVVLVPCTPC